MSHPEPQDRPDRSWREPSRDVPTGDYPYGPGAAGPAQSPWPGSADDRTGARADAPAGDGGWGAPSDPWTSGARDGGASPVRYGGDRPQHEDRYGGGATSSAGLPTSTVVLLVVSGLGVFTGFATLAGVPALILGIVAATSAATDRERAERLTRTGWIVFVAIIAASLLLLVLAFVLGIAVLGGLSGLASTGFGGF
ncbi:hypothetical protein [uncultured Pseudokineococcus sp.]|uniref:hypothetical protein n=1 Tax=uncultured Pseudokineococcus sp. TaxID=1642928 RepID=UPI0026380402|nr:hypothetical protein [uncultured Pseudokineococcus sp.]